MEVHGTIDWFQFTIGLSSFAIAVYAIAAQRFFFIDRRYAGYLATFDNFKKERREERARLHVRKAEFADGTVIELRSIGFDIKRRSRSLWRPLHAIREKFGPSDLHVWFLPFFEIGKHLPLFSRLGPIQRLIGEAKEKRLFIKENDDAYIQSDLNVFLDYSDHLIQTIREARTNLWIQRVSITFFGMSGLASVVIALLP